MQQPLMWAQLGYVASRGAYSVYDDNARLAMTFVNINLP